MATATKLLKDALARVESKSIREWVMTKHNAPIWRKIAKNTYAKNGGGEEAVLRLSTYIVCQAIGL